MSSEGFANTPFEAAAKLALNIHGHLPKIGEVVTECLRQSSKAAKHDSFILSPRFLFQVSRAPIETVLAVCHHLQINGVVSAVCRVYCPNSQTGENDVAFEITRVEDLSSVTDDETECPVCCNCHAIDEWLSEVVFKSKPRGDPPPPFVAGPSAGGSTPAIPADGQFTELYSPAASKALSVSGPNRHPSFIGAATVLAANDPPSNGQLSYQVRLDDKNRMYFDRIDEIGSVKSSTLVANTPAHSPPPDPLRERLPVPGSVLSQFCNLLYSCYDEMSISMLIRFRFDKHLDHLVKAGSFNDRCFLLATLAEREGWLCDLVRWSCHNESNTNPLLMGFWTENSYHFM